MNYHMGCIPSTPKEHDALDEYLAKTQGSPLFSDLAPHLKDSHKGKLILPFKSALKFEPTLFGDNPQQTGDCTSFGVARACDVSRAVEIDIKKEPEEWVARVATEPIYAHRGNGGQGMSVTRAVDFVHKRGFLVRKDYGFEDFTKYNANKGIRLGGRQYPNQWLEAMGEHRMKYVARLTEPEQMLDALANGYGIVWGAFNYQIDSKRNGKGIAFVRSGGWGHCQPTCGADCTMNDYQEELLMVPNSWGRWNGGGHPSWGQLPDGASMIPFSNFVQRIFSQKELFAIGDSTGFPAKDLPDYGSKSWL